MAPMSAGIALGLGIPCLAHGDVAGKSERGERIPDSQRIGQSHVLEGSIPAGVGMDP